MTTPAKKPAAPRATAAKTTTSATAAKPATRAAAKPAVKAAPTAAAKAAVVVAAPVYNFEKPYKFLTGLDDGEFCSKVSAHLNAGYKLAGSATMTTVGGKIYVGQPVYKHSNLAKPKAKPKAKAKGKKK
jgi:hypothetical protein